MGERLPVGAAVDARIADHALPHRVRTVRGWLTLLVFVCTLPAFAAATLYIAFEYQRGRDQLVRDSLATARALTAVVDRELAGTRSALLALASSPYLATDELARFHLQAQQVQRTQNATNIVLIDAHGRQAVNTLRSFGSQLPLEPNTAILGIFQTGQPVVTDLFVGPVARRPLLAVAVPVMRGDKVGYVLAAGIGPERLSAVLTQQRLPPGWVAGIFDSTGTVVARTREAERYVGQKGSPALIARMADGGDGVVESVTLEGTPVVSVFSRSAQSRWSVAIGIPRAMLAGQLRGSLLGLVAATLLLLAVALGAAWHVGRRMARSIRALVAPAVALGHGEPVKLPPLELQEANEVAQAMNRTSDLLQRAVDRASHDALTGLANRTLFEEFLHSQIAVCHRAHTEVSVMVIDLDGFKGVNDRHGHAAGDELLRWVAKRIVAGVRQSDLPARLGGDEFAVVLVGTTEAGARQVAEKILELVSSHPEHQRAVSASIGIAVYPRSARSMDELLRRADQAMYAAKGSGKRRISVATQA
ncbi:sensor domain-containing diguanylate cyclase [Piscinibacter sp. XHJ-5]|uniref:sensor domain-containing diguanylate cyclase n=1 Tax=Piscinibacter sp. XHJ-5 TaxID=3037797 RepID=UPI0024536DC7|nr:sensor domain-containing diguanylate cyclase [Piscinibacter sp. XHJ-5]